MSYDYEYDRMAEDADDLYDLYMESIDDDYDDAEDGYDHYATEYDTYYFDVANEIVDDEQLCNRVNLVGQASFSFILSFSVLRSNRKPGFVL